MTTLEQFLLYNLLPSLVAGALAWLAVSAGIALLRIEHPSLRLCLLFGPLFKSTLVLLGIGMVLPWPREIFSEWQASALPTTTVLPVLLLWAGGVMLGRMALTRQARRLALENTRPAKEESPRLVRALDRVMDSYKCKPPLDPACPCTPEAPRPELRVSRRPLPSPLALTSEEEPVIVFPVGLVQRLSDAELERALAHEVAHFSLRRPVWCSGAALSNGSAVMPAAALMGAQLRREEEKACDKMALAAVGGPEIYAEMLLKSYRFAVEQAGPIVGKLRYVPQLLGLKPMLSERIERVLHSRSPMRRLWLQGAGTWGVWVGIYLLFFRWA